MCDEEYAKYFTSSEPYPNPIAWSHGNCQNKKYIMNNPGAFVNPGNDDYQSVIIPPTINDLELSQHYGRDQYNGRVGWYGGNNGPNIVPDLSAHNMGRWYQNRGPVGNDAVSTYSYIHYNSMDTIKEHCCLGTIDPAKCAGGYQNPESDQCNYVLTNYCKNNPNLILGNDTSKEALTCRKWCNTSNDGKRECDRIKRDNCGSDIANILSISEDGYRIERDVDYSHGGNLAVFNSDMDGCGKACNRNPDCQVAVHRGNTCWLQRKLGDKIIDTIPGTNALFPVRGSDQVRIECSNWCNENPTKCNQIKQKYCNAGDNLYDPLCKCYNFNTDPENVEFRKKLLPAIRHTDKACIVKACSQGTDLSDVLLNSDILNKRNTTSCPPVITVDQSITVNGDNNVLHDIRQNASIEIQMPPVQQYHPEGEYQPPEIPNPEKDVYVHVPPSKPPVTTDDDPQRPTYGGQGEKINVKPINVPKTIDPYVVYGIDLKSPKTYILLFILILVVVALLVGGAKFMKRKRKEAEVINNVQL